MSFLRLTRTCVALVCFMLMSACCPDDEHPGEICSDGSCETSCTAVGQWACNYEHTAVYHCDGTKFTEFAPCAACATPESTFRDTFSCDAETTTAGGASRIPVKLRFAVLGEYCVPSDMRCVLYTTGPQCMNVDGACSPDRKSVLACVDGIWQTAAVCSGTSRCDGYGEKQPDPYYTGTNVYFICSQ